MALEDNDRKWWPTHALDEISPAGRCCPDAWVKGLITDEKLKGFGLYAIDGFESSDNNPQGYAQLKPGDVLDFCWREMRGDVQLTLTMDGYTVSGHVPEDATTFWDAVETDCLMDSMEELANELREMDALDGAAEKVFDISMCRWSKPIPHRLEATTDSARFIPVAPEPASIDDPAQGSA